MKLIILTLVAFASLFTACCSNEDCEPNAYVIVFFASFDSAELSHVIVKKYSPNSKFNELKESKELSASADSANRYRDTFRLTELVTPDFDYEITIPATNTIARITEVTANNLKEKKCADFCIPCGEAISPCRTKIEYCKLNDSLVTTNGASYLQLFVGK